MSSRLVPLLLALICLVEALALGSPGPRALVLLPPERPPAPPAASPSAALEPGFAARMTADDVARGAQALAALGADHPLALDAGARALAAPLAARGAALHARRGALRQRRRALELAWTRRSAELAAASEPARAAALRTP